MVVVLKHRDRVGKGGWGGVVNGRSEAGAAEFALWPRTEKSEFYRGGEWCPAKGGTIGLLSGKVKKLPSKSTFKTTEKQKGA